MQVSDRAKKRGRTQLGTLGAGNHYVEVQVSIYAPLSPPCPPSDAHMRRTSDSRAFLMLLQKCQIWIFVLSTCIWPPRHLTVSSRQLVMHHVDSCDGDSFQIDSK